MKPSMQALSASDWLVICEAAAYERPLARVRRILSAACPAEDVDADTPGLRNRRLLTLCRQLFGQRMACVAACPACGTLLDLALDVQDLLAQECASEGEQRVSFAYAETGYTFRLPTLRDVDDVLLANESSADIHTALPQLASRCLLEGDPQALDQPGLTDALSIAFDQADPLGYLAIELRCPECAACSQPALDPADLLWSELSEMARQLLEQVHVLASAYGWREADILALPANRRRRYIELAGA
jgi:hypothetical protein